jgi:phosphate starvation-inducible membrane PsiE
MDRSEFSLIVEIIKNSIGFIIVFYFEETLNIFQGVSLPKSTVILYLIISQTVTIYFYFKFQKRKIASVAL